MSRKMSEVAHYDRFLADLSPQFARLLMGALQKLFQDSKLIHQLQRGGMNGVAPKVAQKVSVLFEDDDLDARARQQKAEHHSGRPAADDTAFGLKCRGHGFRLSPRKRDRCRVDSSGTGFVLRHSAILSYMATGHLPPTPSALYTEILAFRCRYHWEGRGFSLGRQAIDSSTFPVKGVGLGKAHMSQHAISEFARHLI